MKKDVSTKGLVLVGLLFINSTCAAEYVQSHMQNQDYVFQVKKSQKKDIIQKQKSKYVAPLHDDVKWPNTARLNQSVAIKKQSKVKKKDEKIVCITIPKTGTYLLTGCLTSLGINGVSHDVTQGTPKNFIEHARALNTKLPPNHYKGSAHIPTVGPLPLTLIQSLKTSKHRSFWRHWPYTKESEKEFEKYTTSNFLMIRDPRDQLVSFAHMVHKGLNGETIELDKLIFDFIDGRQKNYIPWATEIQDTYPLLWELGVCDYYKLFLPWMKSKTFYTVRFENLVGVQGGGSLEAQVTEIKNIGAHLGVTLSDDKVAEIISKLFGGTWTFRKGQIGSWKEHFTPEMKAAFKKVPGATQLLIDLGYEKDDTW